MSDEEDKPEITQHIVPSVFLENIRFLCELIERDEENAHGQLSNETHAQMRLVHARVAELLDLIVTFQVPKP
ncbi:MAG TPA: hypothetical protein VGF39_09525 [Stellaceae bacterium]|jgi:hypothetical protein